MDRRYGSSSTFIFRGILAFDEAVSRARALFPIVWQRFVFLVVLPA